MQDATGKGGPLDIQQLRSLLPPEDRRLLETLLSSPDAARQELLARAAAALGMAPKDLAAVLGDRQRLAGLLSALLAQAGPGAGALRDLVNRLGLPPTTPGGKP